MATPYATRHLRSVSSTQDEARRLYEGTPLLVTADRQTGGRGRSGRRWLQAPRGLFASLALRPSWPPATWPRLALVAGLAAREALDGAPGLKWPNDLIAAGGAKLGGLLVESGTDPPEVVFGLGVNLWWPDPPDGVAALEDHDPGPAAAAPLAAAWAESLLGRLGDDAASWGRLEYLAACRTLGREVVWDGVVPGVGRAVDVDETGALVVVTARGRRVLTAGEVRHVRAATLTDRPTATPEAEE